MILKKISKITTRCQILRLKYIEFDIRWGSAPDPAGGAYSALPDPLAVFKGDYFYEEGGKGEGKGRRKREGGRKGKGREGGERPYAPRRKFLATPLPCSIQAYPPPEQHLT